MGYQRNATVAHLMAELRRHDRPTDVTTLAWINCNTRPDSYRTVPWLTGWLDGAQNRAEQLGYRLEEFWLHDEVMRPERLRTILIARGVPGVLVAPTRVTGGVIPFDCSAFATASMAGTFHTPMVHQASADNYVNLMTAYRELLILGYERIGFVTNPALMSGLTGDESGLILKWVGKVP